MPIAVVQERTMTAEDLFSLAGMLVLPGWFLLVLLPRWRYSATLISGFIIPVLLAVLYGWLIFGHMGASKGGFGSLAEVRILFSNDFLLLAGWVHYLAFDLFIGSWEVRDSQRLGIHHLAVIPCLFLTFMLGPVGLLVYLAIRAGWKKVVILGND
jgi:hypothetical protein